MFQGKYFVLGAVVIYVILITLFFALSSDESTFDRSCYDEPCVRFCCINQNCDQKFIDNKLNFSSFSENKVERIGLHLDNFKVKGSFGRPNCMLKSLSDDADWEFSYVSCRV
jgi:hypothetical protein